MRRLDGDDCFDPEKNPALKKEIKLARRAFVPDASIKKVIQYRPPGLQGDRLSTPTTLDWDSEAYLTVAGQNSNNSVRITDDFPARGRAPTATGTLTRRRTGKVAKTLKARDLWDKIGARRLGFGRSRPAVPHHHQRLAHLPGRPATIVASNPCSEYMFLDDTACNLASLNLLQFRDPAPPTSISPPTSTPCACGPWCSKSPS